MASGNVVEVWDSLLVNMNQNPNISDFIMMNGFLKALNPQLLSDEALILSTENQWAKEYIDSKYRDLLSEELEKLLGHKCEALIVLDKVSTENDVQHDTSEPVNQNASNQTAQTSSVSNATGDNDNRNEFPKEINTGLFSANTAQDFANTGVNDAANDKVFDTFHTPEDTSLPEAVESEVHHANKINYEIENKEDRTFESFVVADTNNYAYGAAYSVAENPGVINNPLFIYGRSGLGKTHLLLAIKDYVNRYYPEKKVFYSPATTMIEDFVNSLNSKDWADFEDKYRTADMLLLDDVQYLEGAEETTNEFFKIFNHMVDNKKHIVLSADRAPKDINLDERLKSRFAKGVTADIQAPKFETKLTIFQNNIEYLKNIHGRPDLNIPNDVINRVVELSNSNIRNLEGAAASLVVYISYGREGKSGPISVDEAEEIVSKIFFTNMSEKIGISDIQRFIESYYKITHGELLGSQRPRNISHARQVGMYLSRTMTQASYPEIGKAFKKDHSSVVHACKNIENKRQTDKDFSNELERITDLITES